MLEYTALIPRQHLCKLKTMYRLRIDFAMEADWSEHSQQCILALKRGRLGRTHVGT